MRLDKERPALLLSTDALNRYALDVCVVPLTTGRRPKFSLRVQLKPGEGGLKRNSWVKCDQVTTVERTLLVYPPLGRLGDESLSRVEQAVKLALQLP